MKSAGPRAFTLVELLVTVSIISVLAAILVPAFGKVKRQVRSVIGMNNQRQVVAGVNIFASDSDELYPPSVATIGLGPDRWNWQEPMTLTGYKRRSPWVHRSMSAYLRGYVKDARVLACVNAPGEYKYQQDAWDAGDEWDNPETTVEHDPVIGTYCFYWDYVGCLEEGEVFRGPLNSFGAPGRSKLLMSDYLGYGHWRSPDSFSSCEPMDSATVTDETWVSSSYWSRKKESGVSLGSLRVSLTAGYTDGHVERYLPSETVPMNVSLTSDGSVPYPAGVGPGVFYLPLNALR